jgi:hypothetical protein
MLQKLRRERMVHDGEVELFGMDPRGGHSDEIAVMDFVGDLFKLFGRW